MNVKARDPVCGVGLDTARTQRSQHYRDADYYFCSDACLDQFKHDPGKFATPSR